MGTYTTNYNLYMPTIGEQGWGDLVNGNFTTIDTTMKSLSNRITAVENEVNGALSCTSVTTSGKVTANGGVGTTSLTTSSTITSTGLITANGGVKGNLTGNVTGKLYITGKIATSGEIQYATCNKQEITTYCSSNKQYVKGNSLTVANYSVASISYPLKMCPGVYIPSSGSVTGTRPNVTSRTLTITMYNNSGVDNTYTMGFKYFKNSSQVDLQTYKGLSGSRNYTYTVAPGDVIYVEAYHSGGNTSSYIRMSVPANSTYYIQAT